MDMDVDHSEHSHGMHGMDAESAAISSSSHLSGHSVMFHFGNDDIILFPGFAPQNDGQFIGALIFSFALALITFGIGYVKRVRAARTLEQPYRFARMERAGWSALHQAFHFLVMLLVMTFNVTIFFVVIFGCFIGSFLFEEANCNSKKSLTTRESSDSSSAFGVEEKS